MNLHAACLVNWCQEKDAGVCIQTKLHQHTTLDVLLVLVIFNLAKVNTVQCMCAAALSVSDSDKRLDSLAYIESITDAYSE